jgi:probable selenium-dependent hydroxylase accessory protein YqeC
MPTLGDALTLGQHEVVAFVGAGGKTTAMFRLARELRAAGKTVITTTTTKILVPDAGTDLSVVVEPSRPDLLAAVATALSRRRIPVVAAAATPDGKLVGIPPEWVADLAALSPVTHVLVEADGAARRPFKAPREGEPVIPHAATVIVVVVGVDAIGQPLSAVAHRPEQVRALTGLGADDLLDARSIAHVLVDPAGGAKGAPPHARIVYLLNKADDHVRVKRARVLATELRHRGAQRVVIAALEAGDAVLEVQGGEAP